MAIENKGRITQIIGAVLDIRFDEGHLPEINEAILIPTSNGGELTVEVAQHLGDDTVRCIAMGPTDGLVRGMDAIEAVCVLERYLDEAMRANLKQVRIIHGKGTGTLRAAVQQALKKNKYIKSFRLGQYGEGEDGVTIAEFR